MDGIITVVEDKMAQRMFAAIGYVAHEAYASVEQFVDRASAVPQR